MLFLRFRSPLRGLRSRCCRFLRFPPQALRGHPTGAGDRAPKRGELARSAGAHGSSTKTSKKICKNCRSKLAALDSSLDINQELETGCGMLTIKLE